MTAFFFDSSPRFLAVMKTLLANEAKLIMLLFSLRGGVAKW
jgi:hypothetical protein